MKLKMWNYIHQSTRNSMRNAKNTVEEGLAAVVCEIRAKNANLQKRSKIEKRRQGLVRHFFQKSMKIKMWNYIHQSMRNSINKVERGIFCVVFFMKEGWRFWLIYIFQCRCLKKLHVYIVVK